MLKTKRKDAGLSQQELAKEAGIPLRTIQNWEMRGIEHAVVGSIKKITDVLCCKIEDLL